MTKQDILDYFRDIDVMYNDSSRLDTLSRMLDELVGDVKVQDHSDDGFIEKCDKRVRIFFTD